MASLISKFAKPKSTTDRIAEEFKKLQRYKPSGTCHIGRKADNQERNRYGNILPYDDEDSRVRLKDGDNDYINASRLVFKSHPKIFNYIATQGPKAETIGHFWQMVWEQNVRSIVMLTAEFEGRREKCTRYWPDGESQHGDISVALKETVEPGAANGYTVRSFAVARRQSNDSEQPGKRLVKQFMYTAWPDFGVPSSASALDDLIGAVRKWNDQQDSGDCPIIVHCSAGVGRSGTYMVVDYGRYLQSQNIPVDKIDEWVKELRDQRHGMVQTLEQYAWCYFALGKIDGTELKALAE